MSLFETLHPEVGARPGTLVIPDDAPQPTIRAMTYRRTGPVEETVVADAAGLEALRVAFAEGSTTWVDVQGFGDRPLVDKLAKLFHLHPLLLEDVINAPQRAKTENYGDQLLLIVKMIVPEEPTDAAGTPPGDATPPSRSQSASRAKSPPKLSPTAALEPEQVSIVLGPGYVVTFQERPGDVLEPVRRRIRSEKSFIRKHGADFLAYAVADTIVDAYFPLLEALGDRMETLEEVVVEDPRPEVLTELNRLKNRLANLRRVVWPQREAIAQLLRDDAPLFSEATRMHLRDTYDHCLQTSEVVEMYREMLSGLLNTYLTSVANRTNEVMKVLTIVATIFIPLTFIAGIYGMNFDRMPELHSRYGYPIAWAVMLAVAAAMVVFFRRKGWL